MGANAFRRRSRGLLSLRLLGCGACSDSKSVSVSGAKLTSPARTGAAEESSADTTLTVAAVLLSPASEGEEEDSTGPVHASASTPASVPELLRQLGELERSVAGWIGGGARSESCGVEDSVVVVVKETVDPMGEFRRSMLHMIVEKEIVGGAELGELLRRFLALNSPRYHVVILRAFSEIWEDVFARYERTPDLLRRSHSAHLPLRRLL